MPVYETVLIMKPALSDPEVADYAEKTRQAVLADGGEIVGHEIWGRRKLTHVIGRAREGVYAYMKYKATPALVKKLGHNLNIADSVMRHMTVMASDRKLREKKKKAKAAAAPPATA